MMEFLHFAFAGFWRFCGVLVLISVIGWWLAVIADAFTPLVRRTKEKAINEANPFGGDHG
jgi:hypothetical protein